MHNLYKNLGIGVFVGFVLLVIMNLFTIVDPATTKVGTKFGIVDPIPLLEGPHLVNPMTSFDVFKTGISKLEANGVQIPTKDRFNSTVSITVTYTVEPEKTPYIKSKFITMDNFVNINLYLPLLSYVKDEGRKLDDSRSLSDSSNISEMQSNLVNRLHESLVGTGISIESVLIQDITFDPKIADQIFKTQDRIQKEEVEKSNLRMAETLAKKDIATANGKAGADKAQYDATAYQTKVNSEANAAAIRAKADADRYQVEQIAIGNERLQKSLTPEIIKLKQLEVQMQEAGDGWKGNVPTNVTIMGKDSPAPLFLKQMQ